MRGDVERDGFNGASLIDGLRGVLGRLGINADGKESILQSHFRRQVFAKRAILLLLGVGLPPRKVQHTSEAFEENALVDGWNVQHSIGEGSLIIAGFVNGRADSLVVGEAASVQKLVDHGDHWQGTEEPVLIERLDWIWKLSFQYL